MSTRDTPPIPSWIREFRDTRELPRFLNVFDEEAFPRAWRLHDENHPALLANESMYGRWSDSRVLILARDAGTKWNFIPCDLGGRGFPWVHDEKRRTNRNLRKFADRMECPKLYGSVMSCLVLEAVRSDPLKKPKERVPLMPMLDSRVKGFVAQVLRWIVAHTPRLELVTCLGEDSWTLTAGAFSTSPLASMQFAAVARSPSRPPFRKFTSQPSRTPQIKFRTDAEHTAEWAPLIDFVNKQVPR